MINRFRVSMMSAFFVFIIILPGSCWGLENVHTMDIGLIQPEKVHAETGTWTILDARPVSIWEKNHIPGAISFSWESYTRTDDKKIAYRVFQPEEIAGILGKRGIDEQTKIAVYGDTDTSWGGEAWVVWLLSWLGHTGPVRLIEGGIDAWEKAGFPLTSESVTGTLLPKTYHVALRYQLNISAEALERMKKDVFIVDTRSFMEWITGDRVPGAVHINWEEFYTGPLKTPLDANALSRLLEKNGISFDKPVVYYCTGGIRSSFAWLTHQLAGKGSPVNFEGGTEEWKRRK